MSLETKVVAGVLLALAGTALLVLWLRSEDEVQHAIVQGLAAPAPAAAAQPSPRPVSLLFDFDRAALRETEARKLDALLRGARGTGFKRFDAAGHAGRIGPAAYNLKLSERRAVSVRDYLAGRDVDPALVRASAKGEAAPVTGDACVDMGPEQRANAALVECLQADRRVEVTAIAN